MSSPRRDFESFIAETLLHEFLDSDLKALKSKQKADKDQDQQKRDKGAGDKGEEEDTGKTPKMFKLPGVSEKDKDEEEEENDKKGTIGNTPEKVEMLRTADQNWKQMVAYSKNTTKMIKAAIAKMQTDDAIRMKKAGIASQRLMKMNMGKQYAKLTAEVGGDNLTAKVALMQIISQLIQDLEAGK